MSSVFFVPSEEPSASSLRVWEYRDLADPALTPEVADEPPQPVFAGPSGIPEEEVATRIQVALAEAEKHWAAESARRETERREQIEATLRNFSRERTRYFREVETEVVHLALAIAHKVLEREASLDPELLAALVRIALDRMSAGPVVTLRVAPSELPMWEQQTLFAGSPYAPDLVSDPTVEPGECTVETDMGRATFGVEMQFKAIEQGILDLIKLRPSRANSSEASEELVAA